MTILGIILLFVGVLALAGGALQKYRSGRIAKTPFARTGDVASKGAAVAGDKGAISTEGRVVAPQLVTSPVTQTPCLFYEVKVLAKWKSGDQRRSKLLQDGKLAAPFSLDDGSGPVPIEAGQGGDFELKRTFHQTKGKGIVDAFKGGGIHFGDHGFTVGTGQIVDRVRIPDTAKYEVTERCLMPADQLFALGKLTEHNAIGSPSWASLMLQPRQRDELLAGTSRFANRLLAGGGGVSALGTLLLLIGVVIQVVSG